MEKIGETELRVDFRLSNRLSKIGIFFITDKSHDRLGCEPLEGGWGSGRMLPQEF